VLTPKFRRFADSRTQILAKETKRVAARRGGLESMGVTPARKKRVAAVMDEPEFSLILPHEVAALAGPPTGISWVITRLGVTSLWEKGLTGKSILTGHLDTVST
jgi:hypothetical protein